MPARRRTGLFVAGVLGVAALAGVAALFAAKGRRGAGTAADASAAIDAKTTMPALAAALREGDARALAELFRRTATEPGKPAAAMTEADAADWVKAVQGIRTGYLQFGSYGRAAAMTVIGRGFQRLAVEPAPANWADALRPAHDVIASGLNDGDVDVRATALVEVGKLWGFAPGRPILPAEEDALAEWKERFHTPAVRRLADREPKARAAAVACLGYLPIDRAAAPAVAYLDDPASPEVRKQVVVSFARRGTLLTEEALLKHLFDKEAGIAETVELVLKTRGLTQEQISLGGMIFHPKADIRASVIPLLKNRTDVDPAVWLLQLSRDAEESVRLGAVDALAARLSPEVGRRLAEMAATDASPAVRRAASKYLPEVEKTAALPPLPGSSSLNPTAN